MIELFFLFHVSFESWSAKQRFIFYGEYLYLVSIMEEEAQWIAGILVFATLSGLALLFIGASYEGIEPSTVVLAEGVDSSLYMATLEFITVGGIFLVVAAFLGIAKGMVGVFRQIWEEFINA